MLRNLTIVFFGLLIIFILGVSNIVNEPAQAANSSVFTAQDAVIPGLDLAMSEGSDVPLQLYVKNVAIAGEELFSTYSKHVSIDGNDGEVEAEVHLYYAASPLHASGKFDQDAKINFGYGYLPELKNNMPGRIVQQELDANSNTLVYITQNYWFLNYYYGTAYKQVYNLQYPNFAYFVRVFGAFTSDSVLQDYLAKLSNHCEEVIRSKPKEHFWIKNCIGEVYVQRGGTGPWLPAEAGMELKPYDAVKTIGDPRYNNVRLSAILIFGYNKVFYSNDLPQAYQVDLGGGTIVLLSTQDVRKMGFADFQILKHDYSVDKDNILFSSLLTHPPKTITTPDGIINDTQTTFQVIIDSSGTKVYAYNGSVTLSDLNKGTTVEIREGQMASVKQGGIPTTPVAFDQTSVDQSWVDSAYPNPSPSIPEYPIIAILLLLVGLSSITFLLFRRRISRNNLKQLV